MPIARCNKQCENEFQDKMYGRHMRVFTPLKKSPAHPNWGRCTVCLNTQPLSDEPVVIVKQKAKPKE